MRNRIHNILQEVIAENEDDTFWDLYDLRSELMYHTLQDIKSSMENGDHKRQPWKVIPFNKLKYCWESYMKLGFVRNERLLEDIATLVVNNIVQIDVNTELMGHKSFYPIDEMEDVGLTEEDLQKTDYFDTDGQWRLSDYASDKLLEIALKILRAESPEQKLVLVDQALNVIHQRSDIAEWFVEGGSRNLAKLSGTPSDNEDEDEE